MNYVSQLMFLTLLSVLTVSIALNEISPMVQNHVDSIVTDINSTQPKVGD